MKTLMIGLLVLLSPVASNFVHAQRFIFMPRGAGGDSGDAYYIVADFPADARAYLKQELGCEPKLAWLYYHYAILGQGFDVYRSGGRFVLLDVSHEKYWSVPREVLLDLLGTDDESILTVPWQYYFPSGLVVMGIIIVLAAFFILFSNRVSRRLQALLNDQRYVDAVQLYLNQLTADGKPDKARHQEALRLATNQLVDAGIVEPLAKKQLHKVLKVQAKVFSDALRDSAFAHAEQGHWEEARMQFHEAANLAQFWNTAATKFLRSKEKWCESNASS